MQSNFALLFITYMFYFFFILTSLHFFASCRYLDNKVFVSLANGEVIVYQREAGMLWVRSKPFWAPFDLVSAVAEAYTAFFLYILFKFLFPHNHVGLHPLGVKDVILPASTHII